LINWAGLEFDGAELAFGEWRLIGWAGLIFDGQSWPFVNGDRLFRQALKLMGRVGPL